MKSMTLFITLSVLATAVFAADPPAPATKPAATQSTPKTSKPGAATAKPAASTQTAAAKPAKRGDRLDLETTVVTGNRELPKVMYIVPWKKADLGDLPAQPFNSLLDEALAPVDRDVFRREVTYYGAVSAGADAVNPGSSTPAASPEK